MKGIRKKGQTCGRRKRATSRTAARKLDHNLQLMGIDAHFLRFTSTIYDLQKADFSFSQLALITSNNRHIKGICLSIYSFVL